MVASEVVQVSSDEFKSSNSLSLDTSDSEILTSLSEAFEEESSDDSSEPSKSANTLTANAITGTAPNQTLDLSIDPNSVVVTINLDGTVNISGSQSDDGSSISGIGTINGNPSGGSLEIVGPDLQATWDLDGADSGSLTFTNSGGTKTTITFSNVDTFNAGTGDDEFHISNAYTLPVDISGGAGDDSLIVTSGTNVSITFDGESGNADTIVNQSGATGSITQSNVETLIDRPLLFIPGFGGTFADVSLSDDPTILGDNSVEEWRLNRGIDPSRLALEPLSEAYSDIVETFDNIGYANGTNNADCRRYFILSLVGLASAGSPI